jgi:hypothetical protein
VKKHSYWQCPSCKERFFTLYARDRYSCPECYTRCIKIGLKTFGRPDYRNGGTAAIDPGVPLNVTRYIDREFHYNERDDPERRP